MRINLSLVRNLMPGAIATILAACQTGPAAPGTTTETVLKREVGEYRLESGDDIKVFVLNEPDLSDEYLVDGSGKISLPLIGDVIARGKTLREFDALVTSRLADGFLRNPDVTIELLNYPPYYILGEVNAPGQYPYAEDLTVLKAVATAGGFSHRANQRVIMIKGVNDEVEIRVSLEADTRILPGDTIRILERFF